MAKIKSGIEQRKQSTPDEEFEWLERSAAELAELKTRPLPDTLPELADAIRYAHNNQNRAAEIKLDAERRAGAILNQQQAQQHNTEGNDK